MKTINQINSFLERDQTINFYLHLCENQQRWYNYKNRSFNFVNTWEDGTRHERNISPAGTWIYGQAERQLARYRGTDDNYNYARDNRRAQTEIIFNRYKLQFDLKLEVNFCGIELIVHTNFSEFKHYERFKVKSNETFEQLDIANYFLKKILPGRLYAPGLFQNIQVVRNCSKEDARDYYLRFISPRHRDEKPEDEIDIFKAWKRRFQKKLNIELMEDISVRYLGGLFKSYKRQSTRKKLFRHPSPFELSDMYSEQFDTDGHEEEFLNDIYSDYPKNAIFI